MITYWLWYGARCVTSVLGPEGMTEREVKARAIRNITVIQISKRAEELPEDFRRVVWGSTVKIYPGENPAT